MAIKSTNSMAKKIFISYPKLMQHTNGTIVLMVRGGAGVSVNTIDGLPIMYSTDWDMPNFKDYEGTVTITNE